MILKTRIFLIRLLLGQMSWVNNVKVEGSLHIRTPFCTLDNSTFEGRVFYLDQEVGFGNGKPVLLKNN